jgi:hypothetical protein
MLTGRQDFGVARINQYVFAVAGQDTDDEQAATACTRYDVIADKWIALGTMREFRVGVAIVVL